jgi:hypothetical protein
MASEELDIDIDIGIYYPQISLFLFLQVNIAKDDIHLPQRLREIYLYVLGFMVDGLLVPWANACSQLILRWEI